MRTEPQGSAIYTLLWTQMPTSRDFAGCESTISKHLFQNRPRAILMAGLLGDGQEPDATR